MGDSAAALGVFWEPTDGGGGVVDREWGGGAVGEEECNSENSALHLSCDGKTSVGVIKLLIDSVGRGVFEWTNVDGEIALCV